MDGNGGSAATQSQAARVPQGPITLDSLMHALGGSEEVSAAALKHANEEILGLREALRTRTLIGQAVGMLMAEKGLSTNEAFAELVETSSHANLKLRAVAARMVELADAGAERRRHTSA
jgi:AmiR/NasT family two-component response regulator